MMIFLFLIVDLLIFNLVSSAELKPEALIIPQNDLDIINSAVGTDRDDLIKEIYKKSIEGFWNGCTINFQEKDQFDHLPISLWVHMATYNNANRPNSGAIFTCVAAERSQEEEEKAKLQKFCDLELHEIAEAYEIKDGLKFLRSKIVPVEYKRNIVKQYFNIVMSFFPEKKTTDISILEYADDEDGDVFVTPVTGTSSSGSPPIHSVSAPAPGAPSIAAGASATSTEDLIKAAKAKLDKVIAKGTPIPLDEFTTTELGHICGNEISCTKLIQNVQMETVKAKAALVKNAICPTSGVKLAIPKIQDPKLKDTWMEVCDLNGLSMWIYLTIIIPIVLIVIIGIVVYFIISKRR